MVGVMFVLSTSSAMAFDINAGPIWNNADASVKCPNTCTFYGGWAGQWKTTQPGAMSVCGCQQAPQGKSPNDGNAGPIWSNTDAPGKCQAACQWYHAWNGNWTTTQPDVMSVCRGID